jgi:hypothetical protein
MLKHPGGWETALAVEHVLKKMAVVAPCTFYDQLCHRICQAKSSHVQVITWYLQGFVFLGWWSLFTSAIAASVCQALA